MGRWGYGHFEDDEALDWVWTLDDDTDGSALRAVLEPVAEERETDAPEDQAARALAAAAVVARLRGTSREPLPEEAEAWLAAHGHVLDDDLLETAADAVLVVYYWIYDDQRYEEWTANVERLANDLGRFRRQPRSSG